MLVDVIEGADREDLLGELSHVRSDAETTVLNTLAFGLHTNLTLKRHPLLEGQDCFHPQGGSTLTVTIISVDPYPHHIVAGVQLIHKAIERDLALGNIAKETFSDLLTTLKLTLEHLPQSSKSVQAARAKFLSVVHDCSVSRATF